jgi:SAM-dependent methyltransferase
MSMTPVGSGHQQDDEAIGKNELRLMNSRGREWLLRFWDFPLFASSLRRHGISLEDTSILDAGCGSGYTLELLVQRFRPRRLVAFDIVPSQVEAAKSRGTMANVFVADITALELPPQSFDAVFVCGVLHHCSAWRTGINQVARVLKRGGVLLIVEPGTAHLRFERLLTGRSPSLDTGFSLPALRDEMARSGLTIVEQRPLYFGLFGSFLCVKGVEAPAAELVAASHLLRATRTQTLPAGQEAPA